MTRHKLSNDSAKHRRARDNYPVKSTGRARVTLFLVALAVVTGLVMTLALNRGLLEGHSVSATASGASTPIGASNSELSLPRRGSLGIGSTAYPVPQDALFVAPQGSDSNPGTVRAPLLTVEYAVAHSQRGQTIVLRGGTYHESIFVPQSQDVTIQAFPHEAVWFDGSVPLTGSSQSGDTWVYHDWTVTFDDSASFTTGSNVGGFVGAANPLAAHPDQAFIDSQQLAQVADATTPGVGQFSIDPLAQTLTVGTDPAASQVRASDLAQAFVVSGRLTLRGVGIERYATPLPQIGTVFLGGAGGSRLENVVIDNNATQGLSIDSPNVVISNVTSTNNGMTGIHENHADNSVVQNSIVAANNQQHFNSEPSAAGVKITKSHNVTLRNNEIKDNLAYGLWTDDSVVGFLAVNNSFSGNHGRQALFELSAKGIFANNVVAGGKQGLYLFDTSDVRVFNNAFTASTVASVFLSQDQRRNDQSGVLDSTVPWLTQNILLANNTFRSPADGQLFQFYVLDKRTGIAANSMNLTIVGNSFMRRSGAGQPWAIAWGGTNNKDLSLYATPQAFDLAHHRGSNNSTANSVAAVVQADAPSTAVALPADIAAGVGVPAGSKRLGTY